CIAVTMSDCAREQVQQRPAAGFNNQWPVFVPRDASAGVHPPRGRIGKLSTLQLVDIIAHRQVMQGKASPDMALLRQRVVDIEETQDQARVAIEKLSEAVDKLRAPALRLGTLLQKLPNGRALVCANGTDYICNLDPSIPEVSLETGTRVVLNEAFAVTDSFGFDKNGPVVKVVEVISDGRLRVGNESGISDLVVIRSSLLAKDKLK